IISLPRYPEPATKRSCKRRQKTRYHDIIREAYLGSAGCSQPRGRCQGEAPTACQTTRSEHRGGSARNPARRRSHRAAKNRASRQASARLVRRYRDRGGHPRMARSTGRAGQILMIVVDTNVLSATMRVAGEPAVERWLDSQPPEAIWTTTITIFEIRFGLALLAPGRR